MVCRTERERGGGEGAGEALALEHGGRGERCSGWGYHIFTGISSFKIFIRRSLNLYLFSATPSSHSRLWSSAVGSDILCVCVCVWLCVCKCVSVCDCVCVSERERKRERIGDRASKACMSKHEPVPIPDYPLSLLITALCHSSSFYQFPHRKHPLFCHLFFHLVSVSSLSPSHQTGNHRFCIKDQETSNREQITCPSPQSFACSCHFRRSLLIWSSFSLCK